MRGFTKKIDTKLVKFWSVFPYTIPAKILVTPCFDLHYEVIPTRSGNLNKISNLWKNDFETGNFGM